MVMVSVGFSQFVEDEITVLTDDEDGCRRGPYFCTARYAGHWHLSDEGETWKKSRAKPKRLLPNETWDRISKHPPRTNIHD